MKNQSARAIQLAAEASLCSRFLEKYAKKKMLTALRDLRVTKTRGEDFAEQWWEALKNGEEWAINVDKARRYVSSYFVNIARLYKEGLVSARFVRAAAFVDGINIFFDICEPLESRLNEEYERESFNILRKICGRYGKGSLMVALTASTTKRRVSTK